MIRKFTGIGRVVKPNEVAFVRRAAFGRRPARPLTPAHAAAVFPPPAEIYIEGRIDLNKESIKHPPTTFYMRASGNSMIGAGIYPGTLLVADSAVEAHEDHVVVARIADELCIRRFSCGGDGRIRLLSENPFYAPIEIKHDSDFEVWGRVIHAVHSF